MIIKFITKSSVIVFGALMIISSDLFAQTTATVYTPKGTAVSVLVLSEFSSSQIASINAQAALEYPNAQIIGDASNKYNCHAYAWYLSECIGCTKYWMNTPGDDKYWLDCSYLEVSANQAQKISYASDDHSAVRSNVAGKYESKWGQYPLMRHDPTYTPYNSSYLRYYATLSGPSSICSTGQYSLGGLAASWSSSNPSGLYINPTTGLATRMNNYNGQVTITATFNGSCGPTTFTKNVKVGNYLPAGTSSVNSNCSGNNFNTLNTSLSGACTANTPIYFTYRILDSNYSNFVFTPVSVPSGASWNVSGGTLNMTVNTPSSQGSRSATIALSATGPCGTYNVNFTSTAVNYYSGGYYYSYFPNPASETLTIEQLYNTKENGKVGAFLKGDSSDIHYFRLYNFDNYKVVLEGSLSDKTELDISKLSKGRYVLKIQISNDEEETHHVIID